MEFADPPVPVQELIPRVQSIRREEKRREPPAPAWKCPLLFRTSSPSASAAHYTVHPVHVHTRCSSKCGVRTVRGTTYPFDGPSPLYTVCFIVYLTDRGLSATCFKKKCHFFKVFLKTIGNSLYLILRLRYKAGMKPLPFLGASAACRPVFSAERADRLSEGSRKGGPPVFSAERADRPSEGRKGRPDRVFSRTSRPPEQGAERAARPHFPPRIDARART